MIRNTLTFLLLLTFTNLSYAQYGNITIKEIRGKNECRMCYGKLVVSNGYKTDTIYGGQWGNTPNYEIKEIAGYKLLILDNDSGFMRGTRIKTLEILSLERTKFLKAILKKEITLYRESHRNENNKPTNFAFENNPVIKIADIIEIENNITFEICPEAEGEECHILLKTEDKEYFNFKMLLDKMK